MFNKKGYSARSLDHEGVKKSDASKIPGPISDRCMKGAIYASLSESRFYDRLHDVFMFFIV